MGRGDRRTKRGKIWRGSHGKTRPKKKKKCKAKRKAS
jgi:30S ribosomal protein S31